MGEIMDNETAETAAEQAGAALSDASQEEIFNELCRFLKNGMESDQACLWAAEQGLRITEEQRDILERDLEAFDTSMIPGVEADDEKDAQSQTITPAPESAPQGEAPKKVEKMHLSKQEQRNFIMGVFIILAVAIAVVRFITTQ